MEAFQSGLSWLTILRKREAFRAAFGGFEIGTVAAFGQRDVKRLLADAGIVRNRAKIEATIENGRAALRLGESGESFSELIWSFRPERHATPRMGSDLAATTKESAALAGELKRRGFRFVGPDHGLRAACRPAGWSTITSGAARCGMRSSRSAGGLQVRRD